MKTKKNNDADLIESYKLGNKKALTILIKRWHLVFCEKAYFIVKDSDLAKDIAQDSWKTIITKINDLNNENSFASWALRIVYYKALDSIKSRNKEIERLNVYARNQSSFNETYTDKTEIKKKLLNAINLLSQQQKDTIKLFYIESYSLKEIARIMETSLGTVKSRLFHAREELKKQLKNYNDEK
ncbi:RNA polymerase sigma factor [uncultured Lacinutrix sp.]|uniref:RNA polymerase sigma factor n=1 Tax=uncultured Lacinutrix sp. TaxID=574032 RepID=UPI002620D24A|nr:RNA polymerase sigma factor [uncultured Lacinutrix sp.]